MPYFVSKSNSSNEERKSHLSNQIPLLTTAQRTALVPHEGFMVYDTDIDTPFYFNGTIWVAM